VAQLVSIFALNRTFPRSSPHVPLGHFARTRVPFLRALSFAFTGGQPLAMDSIAPSSMTSASVCGALPAAISGAAATR
jgi:hypothetical protein